MPPRGKAKVKVPAASAKSRVELSDESSGSGSDTGDQTEPLPSPPQNRKRNAATSKQSTSSRKRTRVSPPPQAPTSAASPRKSTFNNDQSPSSELPAENKRLRVALEQVQEAFEALQDSRQTKPEAALTKLRQASDQRVSQSEALVRQYKAELQQMHETLSSNVPKAQKTLSKEMTRKEDEVERLKEQLKAARAEVTDRDATIDSIQKELDFEVAQSKSLMSDKQKAGPSTTAATQPAPKAQLQPTEGSSTSSTNDIQAMLDLSTDLTGLLVSSTYAEPEGQAFDCLLSDVRGRPRFLPFKLVLHPTENGQQSVSYWPKIDKDRDREVEALLDDNFKTLMRFDRSQAGRFFRKAWLAVCK